MVLHAYIYEKTFSRRLHLIFSILLGEEGLQHSVPGMKKDSFTTIISIFKSIKSSQDVVDGNKTKVKICFDCFLFIWVAVHMIIATKCDLCSYIVICCLQTLYAICDLGTLIAKRFCQEQTSLSETQTVPLPAQLYAPLQDNQNENSVVCVPTNHEITA